MADKMSPPRQTALAPAYIWLDRFAPEPAAADPELRRRARLLTGSSLMLAVLCAAFAINALRIDPPVWYSAGVLGFGALLFGVLPSTMRRTNSVALPGAVACAWLMLVLSMLVLWVGVQAPALMVFSVLPMLAFFFVGRRSGLVVACVGIAIVVCVWALVPDGLASDIGYSVTEFERIRILLVCAMIVFVAVMTWLYEGSRRLALNQERAARAQLQESHSALVSARDRAEQANRAKDTFLATVSHEIRTPLHGVVGALELLAREQTQEQPSPHLQIASRSARLLQSLVHDVLDLARVESGHLELEPLDMELRVTLAHAIELHAGIAADKGLDLLVEIDETIPARLHMDALRLAQVVGNLVGNAVKFTESGSVSLRVNSVYQEDDDIRLRCEVQDTGIGIDQAGLEVVFEPFRQGDSSTTRRFGGTGLGLTICRRLVELMGGKIGVHSELGVGSQFWFEVQATVSREPAVFEPDVSPPEVVTAPARVLLVEDNPISQHVTTHLLESLGHFTQVAESGPAALDALASERFDIVLMDCDMPIMDGLEATRRVRAGEIEGEHTFIVALTAHGMAEQHRCCLEAGMDDVLAKPVTRRHLRETLERWLARS